jgi:hypothetical protein
VLATVSRLQREQHPEAGALGNLLYALFALNRDVRDPDALVAQHDAWRGRKWRRGVGVRAASFAGRPENPA